MKKANAPAGPLVRITFLQLLLLLLSTCTEAQQAETKPFIIEGRYTGKQPVVLRLAYNNGRPVTDSVRVTDGRFRFSGRLSGPVAAFFSGATSSRSVDDPNFNSLFIGPGKMRLDVKQDAFKQLNLSGSVMQDESRICDQAIEPIQKEMQPLTDAFKAANEAYIRALKEKKTEEELARLKEKADDIRGQFDPFSERIREVEIAFIQSHPASYYSAYLMRFLISDMKVADAITAFRSFSPAIQQSMAGKQIAEEVKKLAAGSPGSDAYVFTTTDINGQLISLADFTAKKYVLLDFWASWCVPCRHGNPHLLDLYKQYKDKGLEIVGLSDDDRDLPAWKAAVEKDGIGVWRHVLRGLKMNGRDYDRSADISDRYGIHTLPTKILIDKSGKIIGRYGGGGEDDATLDK
ncbi:MAG TPA: TlpA disulfide reductase family protein, partial [Sediminibacterium sp.]|nr:TlpA disulfide reductase family protein [Sediminibacterium sp.]